MKKIFAIVCAMLMALTMTVCVFAEEAEAPKTYAPFELVLTLSESATWTDHHTETQIVDKDGEYTFRIDGLDLAANSINVFYLKEATNVFTTEGVDPAGTAYPEGVQFNTKSLKINDEEMVLGENFKHYVSTGGIVDISNWWNIWGETNIDISGIFDVTSFEVTVEVIFPEATEAPADDVEATTDAPADDTAPETEVEAEETPADTGLALSLIPAAIAMAVVVLKRR